MNATPADGFIAIASSLAGRASVATETEIGARFDDRLADCIDLAEHGEHGIALENLCSNLDEYRIRLSAAEFETIKELAESWALQDAYWARLRDLIGPGAT